MAVYSVGSGSWTYRLYVTESAVDKVNNTSTVTCEMRIYRANSQYSYITNGRYALQVTINGTTQTSGTVVVNKTTSQPEVSVTTLTFTVAHNDDGTGTASITYCQFISSGGTNPATATLGSMPKNITLTYIPRASELTCSSPVVMATTESITVTQKSADFSHILYYSTDGGTTFTEIGRDTATQTYSWTVPDIASTIPNADSATYTLKCETFMNSTYSDTALETVLDIIATVPAAYVPTITIGTITEGNANVPNTFPFVVGVSIPVIPTTFAGSQNSTVVSRSVTANGETQTSTSSNASVSFTMTKALSALSTSVTASTIDSRGRSGTDTATITAVSYNAPTITIDCTRCLQDGTVDALGEYVLVLAKWAWSSIQNGGGELNSAGIEIFVNGVSTATYTTATNNQAALTQIAILPSMLAANQYTITATISDTLLSSTVSQLVTKAVLPLSLFDDDNDIGVTVGRMATQGGFNNWLDLGLASGQNVNLYDANAQVIDTMTTDDLFTGGGSTKFVKGTPIDLYDTDGETVLYSQDPENLVFYDGQGGQLVTFDDRNISDTEMFTVSKVNYSGSVSDNGQVYIPLALVNGYTPVSLSAYVNSSSGGTLLFSAPVFGSNYCYTRCFSRNGASTFNVTIYILHIKNNYVPS